MATLSVISNFRVTSQGITYSGKQGSTDDATTDPFDVTVTGNVHQVNGTLATATVTTPFDDDDDAPADWDFLFVWTSVDMYLQLIGSGSNIIFKLLAKVPFMLTYDSLLAVGNTTAITGGTEPTLTDIDSILLGNYSGGSGNYNFAVVD